MLYVWHGAVLGSSLWDILKNLRGLLNMRRTLNIF
jgi:hypothetical protein